MNNSLPRLIDGMIATLRGEIIPMSRAISRAAKPSV